MALLRMRRKRVFLVLLIACLFWLMYMLTLLPSKGGLMSFPGHLRPAQEDESASRPDTTRSYQLWKKIEPAVNVIEAPELEQQANQTEKALMPPKNVLPLPKPESDTKKSKLDLPGIDVIKNKTYELGIKIKNKTIEVGQKMRNKTLEQLAVIGMGKEPEKHFPQLVFAPQKWNLSVSFEDIGDIMKETQFLNKVDPLNLKGPILVSNRNRTTNFTYSMPLKFGFCDCFERYCLCCSQLTNKRLHLNTTACSNFTFVSKTHEFDLSFTLDTKPVHQQIVSADKPPLLCIGSTPKVADICVHFFNMTYKVNEHNAHQTQILGCTDMSLNLYNKTIGAFPVDCFQIPGDPNQVHKERHHFNNMFNWMP